MFFYLGDRYHFIIRNGNDLEGCRFCKTNFLDARKANSSGLENQELENDYCASRTTN